MADSPADVASADQRDAALRDTVNDAVQLAAYHSTLLAGGMSAAMANRMTAEYQRYLLWPPDHIVDGDE